MLTEPDVKSRVADMNARRAVRFRAAHRQFPAAVKARLLPKSAPPQNHLNLLFRVPTRTIPIWKRRVVITFRRDMSA
jgi:hypothetical protein